MNKCMALARKTPVLKPAIHNNFDMQETEGDFQAIHTKSLSSFGCTELYHCYYILGNVVTWCEQR